MAQLSREQHELTTMVGFMGHEVVEKVNEISREVLPVSRWNSATTREAEANQIDNAVAAAFECAQ